MSVQVGRPSPASGLAGTRVTGWIAPDVHLDGC